MKLIINVPEKLICEGFERHFTEEEKNILIRAIGNGTKLPKGHGRLIDANRANDVARETRTDRDERIIRNFLISLPTIIEADKGDAE